SECSSGQSCVDGACVESQLSGSPDSCTRDEDCTNPGTCFTRTGATCVDSICQYPAEVCDRPPLPTCIEGNTIGLRYESPGTCDVETGCVYEEERIPIADPINCDAIINDDCEILECPETECGVDPEPALNPETGICECFYTSGAEEGTSCSDNNLCTGSASCDDAGRCRPDVGARVPNFEACLDANLAPVQALDDEGNPRTLASGETAPEPYCMNGRCVECQRDTAEQDCNDGNPCTEDTCGFDGLCEHGPTRESESCTIEEPTLHGPSGLCKQGECVECDANAPSPDSMCVGAPPCIPPGTCQQIGERANQCDYAPLDVNGLACTLGDGSNGFCSGGSCAGCSNDSQCDDGNPCTDNVCDLATNTCNSPKNDNTNTCMDGGSPGSCFGGVCIDCSEGSPKRPIVESPRCNTFQPGFDPVSGGVVCITIPRPGEFCLDPEARDVCDSQAKCDEFGACEEEFANCCIPPIECPPGFACFTPGFACLPPPSTP
ncbi:MAG: hypothetical protein AAF219_10855, partial [Myxococcota bacterium]